MEYSKDGAALTEQFESCRLEAYQDSVGVWTIGWGHTGGIQEGDTCTQEMADQWLQNDIKEAESAVNAHLKVPVNQHIFDSVVDLAFNIGTGNFDGSTLLKDINAGDFKAAVEEFEKWDFAGGKVVAGLLRRRLAEKEEFNG